MRILIIGNGFIAKSLIQLLIDEGHEILVFSRTPSLKLLCEQIVGDIFDFENFSRVFSWKPQVVVNTAWITTHNTYIGDPANYKYSRFTGKLAHHLLQTDVEHFVVLGTCAEYGRQIQPSIAGITKLAPATLYAQQKVLAFTSAHDALIGSDIRLSWARIFQPYGKNQDKNRLVPYLMEAIETGTEIYLSDSVSLHDWISTRDIATALSFVINNELPEEVDIGTSIGYSNMQVLQIIEQVLLKSARLPLVTPTANDIGYVSVASPVSPILKAGWGPRDTLMSGLQWMVNS